MTLLSLRDYRIIDSFYFKNSTFSFKDNNLELAKAYAWKFNILSGIYESFISISSKSLAI